MKDYSKESMSLHRKLQGKIGIKNKAEVNSIEDLSLLYSPGVAEPCLAIQEDPGKVYDLTIKNNSVAVVTDGSAVLGLGNIGAKASIPVMEGKAMLFKRFANIDAFPICLDTQDTESIIKAVKLIAPVFGGVNLEDISAPRSFEIESRLQDIGIPVFHDDQHGTAIVVLAGLLNACKVVGKELHELKVVVNGSGAAGVAITRLLRCISIDESICVSVRSIIVCDSKGIVSRNREDLNNAKRELLRYSNPENITGSVRDAIKDADVFIGVSVGNLFKAEDIKTMAKDPIIFALSNPIPEIWPEEAFQGGAAVVATGRSDYPNQVNNVLAFPGIFRGALDSRARRITSKMKLAAAYAISGCVEHPKSDLIIPSPLTEGVAEKVAQAVIDSKE